MILNDEFNVEGEVVLIFNIINFIEFVEGVMFKEEDDVFVI